MHIRIEYDPDYTDGPNGDPGFHGGYYKLLSAGRHSHIQATSIEGILKSANIDPKSVVECDLSDQYDEYGNLIEEVENG